MEAVDEPRGSDPVGHALLACAAGEQSAMATLYDLTAAKVYGLALRVLRNPALAEEVAQEIFVEAWQRCAGYAPDRGSGLAWLLTITHRRAVDRVRSVQASTVRDSAYGLEDAAAGQPDVAEQAVASVEAGRVRKALHGLSHLQRQAVELAFLDGLTHAEVADELRVPLGTVKSRIRDGVTRLKAALGGDGHD
ncbi:ECF RNA polymerase sigma factor SigK [Micropruina sonneratiae]|uniref:ECF RNA polymerase sigma factor SigK n=1 Tax=Micropruina sonneratiae TaxID=2986940 RepID=UPI0022273B01|nr:ECF RNA polymerase sigma factor SigK [Micropruina sp. KQZ13P-5]MCW3158857.1 ECF RNA polymerase sigma factor SigK [Micropruina sp. KQZ13P-5]